MEEHLGAQNLEHAQTHRPIKYPVRHDASWLPLILEKYQLFHLVYQAYRNISRTVKQYLYGDSLREQYFILELRNQFKLPYYCQTPVELIKDGAVSHYSLRKEDSPTKSTEITNCWVITIIPLSSSPTNFPINTFASIMRRLRPKRREKRLSTKSSRRKLSILLSI